MVRAPASSPLRNLPGLDSAWSHLLTVPDSSGGEHRWHVLDNGVRDPIGTLLCVHGNPTWSYLWRSLLAQAPPGWRVVAPDHLGMGYSERLNAPRRLAQRVTDLSDLTEALGIRGPVITVGHDWGGPISVGWGLAHRSQLVGMVLGNTALAFPPDDSVPALIRLANTPLLRALVCELTQTFVRGASAVSWPPLPRAVRRALVAPYASAARRRSVRDFVADIPFASDHPSREPLEKIASGARSIDVRVLLLWGPRDPVFGEAHLEDLCSRFPQSQLHRYERASHLVMEDAPTFAADVVQWVDDMTHCARVSTRSARDQQSAGDRTLASSGTPAPAPALCGRGSALSERAADRSTAWVDRTGVTVSWATLARRVDDLAAGLAAIGVRPKDRVGMLVPPSADLTAAVYAVWAAGAVIVVADKGLGFSGMRRALRSAHVDYLIGTPQGLAAARLMGLPGRRIAVTRLGGLNRRAFGAEHTADGVAALGRSMARPGEPSQDQDCAVVFTSGATGPAKGVVYRHRQVSAQLALLRSTYGITGQDRLVAAFAPFALLGPALGIGSTVPDVDVTSPDELTAGALADAAAAVDATVVFASPAALRGVLATAGDLSAAQRRALSRVRLLMSAGAPVSVPLLRALGEVLPEAEAHTPYGMTEVLPVTDVSLAELDAAGDGNGVCVGRPLPGVEVAMIPLSEGVDPKLSRSADDSGTGDGSASDGSGTCVSDGGLTSQAGMTGEICIRAEHVKDRYDALWATERDSSSVPGWHRTGDVGHLDTEGRLWVEGRMPHVIWTAEGALTPVGVEQRMERLDEVAAAAVVGVGPLDAQAVVVVVVLARRHSQGLSIRFRRRNLSTRRLRGAPVQLAPLELSDAVRTAAAVPVAAVLVASRLPLDIRHASKVDRQQVARWADRVLSGTGSPRARHA